MKIYDLNMKKPLDISKELEVINFEVLQEIPVGSYLNRDFKNWVVDEKKSNFDDDYGARKHSKNTQFRSFQKAMSILLVCGLCLGLNPVSGMLGRKISKIRLILCSWKFLYTVCILIAQTVAMSICVHRLFTLPISINTLAYMTFYLTTWCTTIMFIRIATKWSILLKAIFNCNLDEYVNKSIVTKLRMICLLSSFLALFEHLLAVLAKLSLVINCTGHPNGIYEEYIRQTFPWIFELGVIFNIPLAILMQFVNIVATFNWNYSDMFIVSVSLYLTSIFDEVNKKIIWAADMNYLPSSKWAQLREDYSRTIRLVRLFDDVFSGLIIVSFASNLFFICLQLYNILSNGIHLQFKLKCSSYASGPLGKHAYPIYLTFSLSLLLLRFLTVFLVAASVNVASTVPAAALYRTPVCAYSKEVQRFVDQIHGDVVALSGCGFFYITRELVLSVAGTIVTYELVLLQFKDDDWI